MKTVIVAGGAGLIGSHLTKRLLTQGLTVIVLDNFSTGRKRNLPTGHHRLSVMNCDVTQPLPMLPAAEVVFHLASPASPPDYQRDPLSTLGCGSLATWNLLQYSQSHDARFVFASSSEVYGNPLQHPQSEAYWGNVNPIGPRSMYDEAKRFGEALTMAFARSNDSNCGIVRIFNVYGPHMRIDDGRAVPTFIARALRGQPIPIHGDGTQTRSCCYVDDMVHALCLMAESKVLGPVNLGNPEEVTILDLAEIVMDLVGARVPLVFTDRPTDDPTQRCPDIKLAESKLQWSPATTLRAGLKQTIQWYADALHGPGPD